MSWFNTVQPWLADALIVLGVGVMTIGIYGMIRMPDIYTKLHAASKAVFLGAISLAASSAVTGQKEIIARVVLIGVLLLITTPIASHVIGKAAYDQAKETSGGSTGRRADRSQPRTGSHPAD